MDEENFTTQEALKEIILTLRMIEQESRTRTQQFRELVAIIRRTAAAVAAIMGTRYPEEDD